MAAPHLFSDVYHLHCHEELVFIRTLQSHSGSNLDTTICVHITPHRTRTHANIFLVERVTFHSCALCMAQVV